MKIAKTGNLNEIIQIVKDNREEFDEYGDAVTYQEIIYNKLFAYQKTLLANEIASNLSVLKNQSQFVIRHRSDKEPAITTDMKLIHKKSKNDLVYQILSFNADSANKEWDVIICEKVGQ